MHCGREFLPPVSLDSVRPWWVEIDPVDVELRGPWDPGAPGTHYMGPWARLYYRELKSQPHTRRHAKRGSPDTHSRNPPAGRTQTRMLLRGATHLPLHPPRPSSGTARFPGKKNKNFESVKICFPGSGLGEFAVSPCRGEPSFHHPVRERRAVAAPYRAAGCGCRLGGVSLDPSGSLPISLVCLCTCEFGQSPGGFSVATVLGTPLAGASRGLEFRAAGPSLRRVSRAWEAFGLMAVCVPPVSSELADSRACCPLASSHQRSAS